MAKTVVDDRARQGPRGRPVLYVLIGSLALLAIYMVGLMTWSGSQTPTSPTQAASQSQNSGTTSSNSSSVPAANPAYPTPSANPTAPKP